ncbi:MAG: hypothetical protein ACLGIN_12800 [Candidatus Sericytochromatia bacterium]
MLQLGHLKRLIGLQVLCGLLTDIRTAADARFRGERVPEGLEAYAELLTQEIADTVAYNEMLAAWVEAQEQREARGADPEGGQDHGQAEW